MWSAWVNAWLSPPDGELPGQKLGPSSSSASRSPSAPLSLQPGLAYLVQGEGPHAERGQLDGVQQRDLDEAVGLRAPVGPVLVTFDLCRKGERR